MCGGQKEVSCVSLPHTNLGRVDLSGNSEGLPSSAYSNIQMPQHRTFQALTRAGGHAAISYDEDGIAPGLF